MRNLRPRAHLTTEEHYMKNYRGDVLCSNYDQFYRRQNKHHDHGHDEIEIFKPPIIFDHIYKNATQVVV